MSDIVKRYCPHCNADITSNVYTESWESIDRKFNCPSCKKVLYRVVGRGGVRVSRVDPKIIVISSFAIIGLLILLLFVLQQGM